VLTADILHELNGELIIGAVYGLACVNVDPLAYGAANRHASLGA
jgi:hypothetical protein